MSSIIDRLVFLRSGVQKVITLPDGPSGTLRYILTKRGDHYLKASYPGNIQYHQITQKQIEVLLKAISGEEV